MNLSMKQKQTPRHREQTCGCQGEGQVGEGCPGNQGLVDANYYIQNDKQQDPTVSTGNYIQYPGINHNGKESKKWMYMCI